MSLTSALTSARNALAVRSAETEVVSRNVAGVNEAGYTLKRAEVSTTQPGGIRLLQVTRASDQALFSSMIRASSDMAAKSALLDGVNQLQQTVDPALGEGTPTAALGALTDALMQAESNPSDQTIAQNAVEAAKSLVRSLQDASATTQQVRRMADADMSVSVQNINSLLGQFQAVNTRIITNGATGRDITNDLDARDHLLGKLAGEIGIRTTLRANGDMQIYTDGGATLFDSTPRQVSFVATPGYDATASGNPVMIDGMPVTGADAVMGLKSGRVLGLAQVRDNVAVQYQGQLDEMARGLINTFQETDTSGLPGSARAGLFRNGVSTDLPDASLIPGLAGSLGVAASVDRSQGGNPFLLRDGGISSPNDPAYRTNIDNDGSFSTRLGALVSGLQTQQDFDSSGGALSIGTLAGYASSSTGWIEGLRQSASAQSDQKSAFLERAQTSLSSATGVSLDTEMSKMLDLERAYQGSAKLLSVVDAMLQSLLQAAG